MIAILLAVAFGVSRPGQDHASCIRAVSMDLERSGEAASDIARATVAICIPTEMQAQPGSTFSSLSAKDQTELIQLQRKLSETSVVVRIIRLRACRKTQGCDVSTLP